MYGLLLKDQAKALYARHTSSASTLTVQVVNAAITEMTKEYLPIDCAKNTSRYLFALKKPYDMTIETFYTRVKTIDSYLPLMLPPMNVSLSANQLTALVEHAVPSEWLHQLNLQQTLGQNLNMSTMIQYFKVLEVNERKDSRAPNNKASKQHSRKSSKGRQHSSDDEASVSGKPTRQGKGKQQSRPPTRTSSRTNPTGKWYSFHKSTSHNTAECRANTSQSQDQTGPKSQESNAIESNKPSKSTKQNNKRKPKEEIHEDSRPGSEASDENYAIIGLTAEAYQQGVPRCDLKLIIRGPNGKQVCCRALLDTGSSKTIVEGTALLEAVGIVTTKAPTIKYSTKKGTFSTNKEAILRATFPQFSKHRLLVFKAQVDDRKLVSDSVYDIILGRDFLQQFHITLDFSTPTPTIHWDELTIDMVYAEESNEEESTSTKLSTKVNNSTHISTSERHSLHATLKRFNSLFTETIGLAQGVDPIQLQLTDSTPIQCRPIPIPQSKVAGVKRDIQDLCELGVLEPTAPSRWSFPSFIVPKKDRSARVVTDFRKLNHVLMRKPFPIPTLNELVHSLHGFTYVTTLDLHKGYYHFLLSRPSRELCTTVLPWGYYRYKRLPMGISVAADIFQYKVSKIFIDLPFVLVYFDDIFIYSKGEFADYIDKLQQVLARLLKANLQVNLGKCQFAIQTVDYLGYTLTRAGFKPQVGKVAAILQLQPPRTVKQVRKFLGFINFYKDFIKNRSTILQPIVNLTKKNAPFKWTALHDRAFHDIKQALAKDTLIHYPNPNLPFDVYADASDTAVALAIFQNSKPVSFFSQTLSPSQRNYTVTQKKTLALVKGLQANRNIFLGRVVNIYTDHRNITFLTSSNPQTLRWRLVIAEYNP